MITFLDTTEYQDWGKSLDPARARNQIFETRFMLDLLVHDFPSRWRGTCMVEMWRGAECTLLYYGLIVSHHVYDLGLWNKRCQIEHDKLNALKGPAVRAWSAGKMLAFPEWMTDEQEFGRVVRSHQRRLYQKKPDFYPAEWGQLPDERCHKTCQYYWPTHGEKK